MFAKFGILNWCLGVTFTFFLAGAVQAQDGALLDELFERLQTPDLAEWEDVERQIWAEWAKSGSDAMDLLLERGRDALEAENYKEAVEHLTALTDHAPDFAEGYHLRATAYFHQNLYGPSLADLEQTLALNPRHFGAMSGLGTILYELGRDKQALEVLLMAQDLHPHREDYNNLIAQLKKSVGGFDI